MDRAMLRRCGATVHKIYEKYSTDNHFNDDAHFGTTMGILSGDLANQLALEIIGNADFPLEYKNELIKLVALEVSKVCFGQIHDILLNYDFPINYGEDDILKVHYYKTATYTYRLPLFSGAILAGASKSELEMLDGYAMPSGIAFQIRDDVLGVFGEIGETGKDIKGDLMEGKKTLLVTEAYKHADSQQIEQLKRFIGKKDLTDTEADIVRDIFRKTGSLNYSINKCQEQIDKAKTSLSQFSTKTDSEAFHFLSGIADYMLIRNV